MLSRRTLVLVLFDIDGTILTSQGAGRRAVAEALEQVCSVQIRTDGVSFAGRTDAAIMRDLLLLAGLADDRIDELFESCLDAYVGVLMRTLKPGMVTVLPGVRELLDLLSERPDVALGLLTGNLQDTAFLKLHAAGLGSLFRFGAYGSDEDNRHELPEIAALRANEETGTNFDPRSTIILGDTPNDISCAHRFGAHSVAVCTGTFERESLETLAPTLLLDDLSDPIPVVTLIDEVSSRNA